MTAKPCEKPQQSWMTVVSIMTAPKRASAKVTPASHRWS